MLQNDQFNRNWSSSYIIACKPNIYIINTKCNTQHTPTKNTLKQFNLIKFTPFELLDVFSISQCLFGFDGFGVFVFLFCVFLFPFFFFFFSRVIGDKCYCSCTVHEQQPNILTFQPFSAYQWVPCTVYRTHKFHFSATFSSKMGSTALFTYLKIILLQCFQFSVFNFSKISYIQTDP